MRSTGIVRKVDQLGRLVLPKELRDTFGIENNKTAMEIFTEGEEIILKKYEPCCIFCRESRNVIEYKGKLICKDCLKELKEAIHEKEII